VLKHNTVRGRFNMAGLAVHDRMPGGDLQLERDVLDYVTEIRALCHAREESSGRAHSAMMRGDPRETFQKGIDHLGEFTGQAFCAFTQVQQHFDYGVMAVCVASLYGPDAQDLHL
jgi:hypothetical protein